jgi:hypothetical protein
VSLCHAAIAVFSGRLVLLGGLDCIASPPRPNQSLLLVPLKEGRVASRPVWTGEVRREEVASFSAVGATHVGEGWMVFLRAERYGQNSVVRLRRLPNEAVEVEVLKGL